MILDQEILRSERYGLEFSLIFIDLDFFKEINDTRGHLDGSQALKEVAVLLRESVRESDILFRYGGDEFTSFLVETGPEGAEIVAERIRHSIQNHAFFSDSGNPAHITATVGYATFPSDAKHQTRDYPSGRQGHVRRKTMPQRGSRSLATGGDGGQTNRPGLTGWQHNLRKLSATTIDLRTRLPLRQRVFYCRRDSLTTRLFAPLAAAMTT